MTDTVEQKVALVTLDQFDHCIVSNSRQAVFAGAKYWVRLPSILSFAFAMSKQS